jgi:hypothetical protein
MIRDNARFLGPLRPLAKRAAKLCFPGYSWLLDRLNWEARLGATTKEFPDAVELKTREDLYSHISDTLLDRGKKVIDYLEFGVFEGASMRSWVALNQNRESRFFGFDSFEGLPEDWHSGKKKGSFSTCGKQPVIADTRVSFVAGWFQNSLREFLASYRPQSQLVIHVDCDVYSSTLYCLTMLDSLMAQGTVIVLDDFFDALHVYRALSDYCSAYLRQYAIVARTHELGQVSIVMR